MLDNPKKMNFIIVIPVYSRPLCLKKLIECLVLSSYYKSQDNQCHYHLCFSVDPHPDQNITKEILAIIDRVEWHLGEKQVIEHKEHLGLFKNILFCGGLSKNYDACIVLESDLIVSPFCLDYIYESHKFFNEDSNIAGISLYSYQYSETEKGGFPFTPINEGCDNYFLRFPSSWGQIWNYRQWSEFETWLANNYEENFSDQRLPENVCGWSSQSWKKQFCRYLVDTSKYFVYPHVSLSSHTGEVGTHCLVQSDKYKVPLLFGIKKWNFKGLKNICIVYDQFFQPELIYSHNGLTSHDEENLMQKDHYFLLEESYLTLVLFNKCHDYFDSNHIDYSHINIMNNKHIVCSNINNEKNTKMWLSRFTVYMLFSELRQRIFLKVKEKLRIKQP